MHANDTASSITPAAANAAKGAAAVPPDIAAYVAKYIRKGLALLPNNEE